MWAHSTNNIKLFITDHLSLLTRGMEAGWPVDSAAAQYVTAIVCGRWGMVLVVANRQKKVSLQPSIQWWPFKCTSVAVVCCCGALKEVKKGWQCSDWFMWDSFDLVIVNPCRMCINQESGEIFQAHSAAALQWFTASAVWRLAIGLACELFVCSW